MKERVFLSWGRRLRRGLSSKIYKLVKQVIHMEKTFISVRDVDTDAFRKFRAMSIRERLKLGEALTIAMRKLMEEKEINKFTSARHLLLLKPFHFGKENKKLSMEVDKILYG